MRRGATERSGGPEVAVQAGKDRKSFRAFSCMEHGA